MSPTVIRAASDGDRPKVAQLLGVSVPTTWEAPREFLELRLRELEASPALQPWLIRGISLRSEHRLIGDIGFHSAPVASPASSPKSVELGYSVIEAWRRRGFAQEAIQALIQWACDRHHVHRFVLSIGPENKPSQGLAAKLGFQKIGSKIDEIEGLEKIFERID